VDEEYKKRSPLTYMAKAKGLKVQIGAGIFDGHRGNSSPRQPVAPGVQRTRRPESQADGRRISYFVEKMAVPPKLEQKFLTRPTAAKQPLFRRSSGNATVHNLKGGTKLGPTAPKPGSRTGKKQKDARRRARPPKANNATKVVDIRPPRRYKSAPDSGGADGAGRASDKIMRLR